MINKNSWDNIKPNRMKMIYSIDKVNIFLFRNLDASLGILFELEDQIYEENQIKFAEFNYREKSNRIDLTLNNPNYKDIFSLVCSDIIINIDFKKDINNEIKKRLNRWKELLKNKSNQNLSMEIQMGIFSELKFLLEVLVPKLGIEESILSWNGPEKDKQDFITNKRAIEVKSHKTSKGKVAIINSKDQLFSEVELYLVNYSLSINQEGNSIRELYDGIMNLILEENIEQIFLLKLLNCNYFPEDYKGILYNFSEDSINYYLVDDIFPKIDRNRLPSQIINLNYTVDLTEINTISENEFLNNWEVQYEIGKLS